MEVPRRMDHKARADIRRGPYDWSHFLLRSVLSVVALVLLGFHLLNPEITLDAASFGLIALALLPWLSELITSFEFPGGWKVPFRDLQDEQDRQRGEIEALTFLVSSFLTPQELALLQKFANPTVRFEYTVDDNTVHFFENEIRRLRSAGLIRHKTSEPVSAIVRQPRDDLHRYFEIAHRGNHYLQLLADSHK